MYLKKNKPYNTTSSGIVKLFFQESVLFSRGCSGGCIRVGIRHRDGECHSLDKHHACF
jgi:hypothetical protein